MVLLGNPESPAGANAVLWVREYCDCRLLVKELL
jgi:hypothetical protein